MDDPTREEAPVPETTIVPDLSIPDLLRRTAVRFARLPAILFGDRTLDFAAVDRLSDAVAAALAAGTAELVVVAADARAAAETPGLDAAIAAGLVRVWGTKADIGRAVGRAEVGVVAVQDAGLGRALSTALQLAQMPAPAAQPNRTAPGGFTEDG